MQWTEFWWVWVVAGGVLGIVEVALPGFIFLGFAAGAVLTGILVATGLLSGVAIKLFVFAIASLVAWYGLKRAFGRHEGQVKVIDRDINEN
jgi:membrane protein implicated in regulation of membrane protease activity